MRTIMMESITAVKTDIYMQGKRRIKNIGLDSSWARFTDSNGEYNCGCMINPRHFTICKLCDKHYKMMEGMNE